MKNPTLYDRDGRPVRLVGSPKKGGEGEVFMIEGDDHLCAKRYYPDKITPELKEKLSAMVANPPGEDLTGHRVSQRASSIAWPVSLIYERPGAVGCAGFLMPLIDMSLFREAHRYYDPEDRRRSMGGGFNWRYLLTTALNVCYVIAALHARGHCVGDLSGTNILVARTAAVTIIDCDSFQISDAQTGRTFYTRVGTGDYLPPELMGHDFRSENLDRFHSDLFALGILVFKLLMGGVHPYQARGSALRDAPSTEEKIRLGYFPYSGRFRNVRPPKYAPPYAILPPAIQHLFNHCFLDGHDDPSARPDTGEWIPALRQELSLLSQCDENPYHWYGRHLSTCPWCAVKQRTGHDPFPLPEDRNPTSVPVVVPAPSLSLDTGALFFSELRPGDLPVREFVISNSGIGCLSGRISTDRPWLLVSTDIISTTGSQTISLKVRTEGMSVAGGLVYVGRLTLRTNGGTAVIPVELRFAEPEGPLLAVGTRRMDLICPEPSSVVEGKFSIRNNGAGLLTGTAVSDMPWLRLLSPDIECRDHQELAFQVDASGIAEGPAFARISVQTSGGRASLDVEVEVRRPPVLMLTERVITMKEVERNGGVRVVEALVRNGGGGSLKASVSSGSPWLSAEPMTFLTGDEIKLRISVDPQKMGPAFFQSGKLKIRSNGGSGEILVALTLRQD